MKPLVRSPARLASILFCLLLPAVLVAGCRSGEAALPEDQAESMKGFEIYSWQDDGDWRFSLLVGTNRNKSFDEVTSPDTVLKEIEDLETALRRIRAGQFVIWWVPVKNLSFPPDEVVERVQQICQDQGLELTIAR